MAQQMATRFLFLYLFFEVLSVMLYTGLFQALEHVEWI